MTMHPHFAMFARYNAWANRRLFSAAADLSDADYRADCGAFFKSVHGTLNHLLVTDRIWLGRFRGDPPLSYRLDSILFDECEPLRVAREVEDEGIIAFVDGLDEASLAGTIAYRRVSSPEAIVQTLSHAMAHWFNHQTHHRGQCHALLTRLAGQAPELDLLFYQREVEPPAS